MHTQQFERSLQALRKIGIGGNDARWYTVPFADDDAVGEFVAVVDGAPTSGTPHQLYPLLIAHIAQYFALDVLKTSQRDGGRRPAKDAQRGRRFIAQVMQQHRLVDSHIHSRVLDLSVEKTIGF